MGGLCGSGFIASRCACCCMYNGITVKAISSYKNALGVRSNFCTRKFLRWQAFLIYNQGMKKIILCFFLCSSSCFGQVQASNVVANVSAYTGAVCHVSGRVESVKKDGMSSGSYIVMLQGLSVRVFFDPNKQVLNRKTLKVQRATFEQILKPSCGSLVSYSGTVKKELGKPFLITEKDF